MNRINCEIVRDLIPSYVDGICSQSSKEAVEEHVKSCGECRESLETLRRTAIGGDKAAQGELDLMKKVKRHFVRKSLLTVGAMALALLLFGNLFDLELWYKENLYYVLFPLIALGTHALLAEYPPGNMKGRKRLGLGAVSALGILYSVILAFVFCGEYGTIDMYPERDLSWLGPVMEYQMTGISIVELAIFAWFVADSLKNAHGLDSLHIVSLLGAFMGMILRLALHNMSTPAKLQQGVTQMLVTVFLEGVAIAVLEACAGRYLAQKPGK